MPGSRSHRERRIRLAAAAAAVLAALPLFAEQPADEAATTRPAEKPEVTLPLTSGRYVRGRIVSADEKNVVIEVGDETRTIALEELKPVGVYRARKQLADPADASVRMELARFLIEHGELSIARRELKEVMRLDADLRAEAKKLLDAAASEPVEQDEGGQDDGEPRAQKYAEPTGEEIEANHRLARELAEKAKAVAPALHLVETEHFLIFSAWAPNRDKSLGQLCERMYKACCRHFDVRESSSVFVGKCPVFLFWDEEHFRKFADDIDGTGLSDATAYVSHKGGNYCHIVISRVRSYDRLCEVLVHEGTHAFLGRYISSRSVPQWVNEGLAEYTSASLVPRSVSARRHSKAVREALLKKKDVSYIFDGVSIDDFDYGIAHSLVRFMLQTNRRGFVKFVTLMKEGTGEEDALEESYGCTHEELLRLWYRSAGRSL